MQRYDIPVYGLTSSTRAWAVDTPCAQHPERLRAIVEIGASDLLEYAGGLPLREIDMGTPPRGSRKH